MLALPFPVIDADAHVNEPPDLWESRLPAGLRERGPRLVRDSTGGDVWLVAEGQKRKPFGLTALAGRSFLDYQHGGLTYEGIRPSSYDPHARLQDMALDGIAAQVLYPSVALSGAQSYSGDLEMQAACTRVYNDWLAEFCQEAPGQLFGMAIVPATGIQTALTELKRARELGHRGVMLSSYPNGGLDPDPNVDDEFWSTAQSLRMPVGIHIGSFSRYPLGGYAIKAQTLSLTAATKSGAHAMQLLGDLIFSGITERFPELQILLVEANIGWIPSFLEKADDNYLRHRFWSGADRLPSTPTEYFRRQIYVTFMVDRTGVDLRHHIGVNRLLWSTDFPHAGSDWPNSRWVIERNFTGVPEDEQRQMLHDNAAGLFGIAL